jgi:Protein of unknown function (DUF433)
MNESSDAKICHGKPVIGGTRMPVARVVGSLAGGMSFEEVQREFFWASRMFLKKRRGGSSPVRLLSRIGKKPKSQSVIGSNED